MWIFQLVVLGLTVTALVVKSLIAWRRRVAVLRTERPGELIYERPRVLRARTRRVDATGGRFGVSNTRHDAHVTMTSSGIEVHADEAPVSLAWERHRDGLAPTRGNWTMRPEANDGGIVALVVEWGPGAPTLPEAGNIRSAKISGEWYPEEWACFSALVCVLAARPELRPKMDDPLVTKRLVDDIGSFDPMLPAQHFGSFRRRTVELETAMKSAGFVHPFGRPLPDWAIPALEDAVVRVAEKVAANPYARNVFIDREDIVERVRLEYLDVDPWPFHALFDL